ncbi:MAG: cysteine desulfurase family protein [Nanoarchaeota archaeon]
MSQIDNKRIYLDNAATTPLLPEVEDAMRQAPWGNPSSIHSWGVESMQALEDARCRLSSIVGCHPCELFFTSGGTEANNWILKGYAWKHRQEGLHIVTTRIEHDCVLNACRWLENQGFEVTYLDVDAQGMLDPQELAAAVRNDTILVSIIQGNNEMGAIQDLDAISRICREHDVPLHIDACQSFTKIGIDTSLVDMMTINAHKIHGPKGVGAVYIRKGLMLDPLLHGGGQENRKRSGTQNVPAAVGFAKAAELSSKADWHRVAILRDMLIEGILTRIHGSKLNGPVGMHRLPNNVNISFSRVEGESIIEMLNLKGVAASTGSACSSKSLEASHVLTAMGRDAEAAHGSVRLTLSPATTEEEIAYVLEILPDIVARLAAISPLPA